MTSWTASLDQCSDTLQLKQRILPVRGSGCPDLSCEKGRHSFALTLHLAHNLLYVILQTSNNMACINLLEVRNEN